MNESDQDDSEEQFNDDDEGTDDKGTTDDSGGTDAPESTDENKDEKQSHDEKQDEKHSEKTQDTDNTDELFGDESHTTHENIDGENDQHRSKRKRGRFNFTTNSAGNARNRRRLDESTRFLLANMQKTWKILENQGDALLRIGETITNKPYYKMTKEEYKKRMEEINLKSYKQYQDCKLKRKALEKTHTFKNMRENFDIVYIKHNLPQD